MSRVLLVGESWFVHSIHQKGFDSFTTSEFTLGGGEFRAALEAAGHSVEHLPAHEIATGFPATAAALRERADVVVVSDVGANSFQLLPATFTHSQLEVDRTEVLRDFVLAGGGLAMIGGFMTFSGIDAKARWGRTVVAEVLPVSILDRDDRVELPGGAAPQRLAEHPIVAGLDAVWPPLLGLNEVRLRDGASLLAACAGHPLLAVGDYGAGRSAAFTSDLAPHWAPPGFLRWAGYGPLFDRLVRWLNREI
ncbi:glutamine amidotransferase [Galbitalea soli]|uniref:Cytoplasmic protein n=1 Tax=Galbitalea soli TaxID=1268042 RepID=A0A7C9TS93_9MICO|nr:glutamine amidotransferase [Galbitalea soli]NEM92061.1 cytoplasmic protein [Galbitalea soli]NYJ31987.1 putative membrane protein [Galbitalea soli]